MGKELSGNLDKISTKESDPDIRSFATERDTVMMAFVGSYVPRKSDAGVSEYASINVIDEFGVESMLTDIKENAPNSKKAFLLVNSTGGSPSSAYKIAHAIRKSFDDITVFVPHNALSGGTLLALIGDRIRMDMMSQLGPLDMQVPYKGQMISVNSLFRARQILDRVFQIEQPEEISHIDKHMAEILDPIIMGEWAGIQEEGILYLKSILEDGKYGNDSEKLARKLSLGFPSHDYVINMYTAKVLGIRVEYGDVDKEAWSTVRSWLSKYLVQEADLHFIRYAIPNEKE